ncbi:MAG: hypothetical protein HKM95_02735 [Inquilinus sp.]|nr:hypothetical protein [Inquilinus sp.]
MRVQTNGGRSISAIMYSHDGVGLGHLKRNLTIASRLVHEDADANVLLVVGCPSGMLFDVPHGVDYVKLPSIAKVETNTWNPRKLRMTRERIGELRRQLLLRVVELFEPDLFLADHVPAGVWGELLPTLQALRDNPRRPKVALGLRDILDRPEIVRRTWRDDGIYDVIERYYDAVLVYGAQGVFDTAAAYGIDEVVPDRIRYCGYVSGEEPVLDRAHMRAKLKLDDGPLVVITAGGGADAFPMMEACIAALKTFDRSRCPNAMILTGALMDPSQRAELERRVDGQPVRVLGHVPDAQNYISAADLAITMGGYNTMVECVRLQKPTIVLPRKGPSAEQATRARVFGDLGLVTAVEVEVATPERLARAIRDKLAAPRVSNVSLGTNGVSEAVRHLLDGLLQNDTDRFAEIPVALEAL